MNPIVPKNIAIKINFKNCIFYNLNLAVNNLLYKNQEQPINNCKNNTYSGDDPRSPFFFQKEDKAATSKC